MSAPIELFLAAMGKDRKEIIGEKQLQRKHFPQTTSDFSTPTETFGNGVRMIGMKITRAHRSTAAFGMPLMIPDLKSRAAVPAAARLRAVDRRFATPTHPASVTTAWVFASSSRFRPGEECRSEK